MMQYFQNQYPAICEKLEKDNFLDPDATYIQHPDIYSKVVYNNALLEIIMEAMKRISGPLCYLYTVFDIQSKVIYGNHFTY